MYQLVKYSAPGWVKGFESLQAIAQELHRHTCTLCQDSYGTDLDGMLASECGAEYGVRCLDLDGPATAYNGLQEDFKANL